MGPTMPLAGDTCARAIRASSQPGVTTVSLLRRQTYSPRARLSASLQAAAMSSSMAARQTSARMRLDRPSRRPARYSAVPSREPMSMKISSTGSRLQRRTLGTQSLVNSSIPQQGMRIDTRPAGDETEMFEGVMGHRNPKSEIRNPKQIPSTKKKTQDRSTIPLALRGAARCFFTPKGFDNKAQGKRSAALGNHNRGCIYPEGVSSRLHQPN